MRRDAVQLGFSRGSWILVSESVSGPSLGPAPRRKIALNTSGCAEGYFHHAKNAVTRIPNTPSRIVGSCSGIALVAMDLTAAKVRVGCGERFELQVFGDRSYQPKVFTT